MYEQYDPILEPHGAVGLAALEQFLKKSSYSGIAVSLETAHPAKFPREIEETLEIETQVPTSMKGLEGRQETFEQLPANYQALKNFLLTHY